ncbi:hypothetical protein [Salinimicrobium sp. GXAS 041]|uniref:hypothetical protein n=1 Tax=Salinimicrobium sp. GXAS 041 TaxID=3400806 RepID=UPI003C7515E5
MIKIHELEFGTIRIQDKLLISELKEGILFDVESNRQLLKLGEEEFQGQPYGYISNRIFSYAVDPLVYRESAAHLPLKAIAVVTNTELGWKSAELEKSFYSNSNRFEIFRSCEEAVRWMDEILHATANQRRTFP